MKRLGVRVLSGVPNCCKIMITEAQPRVCTWCFKEITDDFIMTNEGDNLHYECFREADTIIEANKTVNSEIH